MKAISSLVLIALLAFTACKKKTSDPEPDPAPTTTTTTTGGTTGSTPTIDVNSTPQVSYSLAGTAVSYVTDEVNYIAGSGSSGSVSYTYDSNINNDGSKVYFNITKGTINTGGGSPDDDVFKTLFPVGTAPYTVNAANGVEVSIWDANDVMWSTSLGSQSGSTFNIVQTKDQPENYFYIKTYITFSCKVYNAAGAMKTITNGKYVGHFGNF
jgi:hypothetical protein